MKVAALAEAHYVDLMPHNPLVPICTAASVHLAAAVPNFAWLEYRNDIEADSSKLTRDLFIKQCELDGSMLRVPVEPGWGWKSTRRY